MINIPAIDKINTNSDVNQKEHVKKKHLVYYIRIASIFIFIFFLIFISSIDFLTNSVSSIFSVHSSTSASINFFLHLQSE